MQVVGVPITLESLYSTPNLSTNLSYRTYIDAEQAGHAMQIVGVPGHCQHLGYHCVLGPFRSKLLH
jgi:hypothetical protein